MRQIFVALALVAGAWGMGYRDDAMYEDMLAQDLYKRLSELTNNAIYDVMGADYNAPSWDMNDIALQSRESGQADLRDQEFLEHSSIGDGFQYISGGAGEGKQHLTPSGSQDNTQEVKSDEVLPFYCHPPNPCPKGKTAEKDGCHEFIDDTAEAQQEWILKMQSRGMCACDDEHMFKCPTSNDVSDDYTDDGELDAMLDKLLGEEAESEDNPYMIKTAKREYIVPKKRFRMKRSVDHVEKALEQMKAKHVKRNPYLDAPAIRSVAKKG